MHSLVKGFSLISMFPQGWVHTHTHARTHARTHTRTHARTHTHTHSLLALECIHTLRGADSLLRSNSQSRGKLIFSIDIYTILHQELYHRPVSVDDSCVQGTPAEGVSGVHVNTRLEEFLHGFNVSFSGCSGELPAFILTGEKECLIHNSCN